MTITARSTALPATTHPRPRRPTYASFLSPMAIATIACLASAAPVARAADSTPSRQLERWSAEAARAGDAARGRTFFTTRHGGEWSCASCHGEPPSAAGRHAGTGKAIEPLAPAANPTVFTDTAKTDKWFRRNCKDVLGRECSAAEKADVLAYLVGIRT